VKELSRRPLVPIPAGVEGFGQAFPETHGAGRRTHPRKPYLDALANTAIIRRIVKIVRANAPGAAASGLEGKKNARKTWKK
jgi:hypothetical protein